MAKLEILQYPDDRLRAPSQRVEVFDSNLGRLVDDLLETLYATNAIALSAPQVNDHREVLVVDLSGTASEPKVYVNPEIISKKAWGLVEESCLSIPGIKGNVIRATQVYVRSQDRHGTFFESELTGMDAVCVQHEIDHFSGKLFIDRLSFVRRFYIFAATKLKARRNTSVIRDSISK